MKNIATTTHGKGHFLKTSSHIYIARERWKGLESTLSLLTSSYLPWKKLESGIVKSLEAENDTSSSNSGNNSLDDSFQDLD